jgi:nucleotide-binding universal stress UspA family protein
MGSVLLATDGSDPARRAAERAIEMAADGDGRLDVLGVVDRRRCDQPALGAAELVTIYAEDEAATAVAEVREMAAGTGVVVEGDTRRGVPADVILDRAEAVDADAIVVGAHGDHGHHLSGVGRQVRRRSDREVVVVD